MIDLSMNKKMIFILILAAFLRLFMLNKVPASLNWDEVSMGYTAYSLAYTGMDEWGEKLPLFFRSYGEWKSAVYIYALVPFVQIFGLNAWAVRLPSALAGIASVWLIYLLTRKLYGEKIGLWSAFLMSVTPWHLMLSRPAFEANMSLTLLLAGTYLFFESKFFWSAVFFGLAPHTYNSAKFVIPVFTIYLFLLKRKELSFKKIFIFFFTLAIFAYPILINLSTGVSQKRLSQVGVTTELDKVTTFIGYRQTLPVSESLSRLVFNRYTYTIYRVGDNLLSYLDPSYLIWNGGPHNQYRVPLHGIFYISEYFLALGGICIFIANLSKSQVNRSLPFMLIFLGLVPAALTKGDHHVLRSILALPGWIILAANGIGYLDSQKSLKKVTMWIVGILICEAVAFISIYFYWYPRVSASDWQYGYKEAIQYVQENKDKYDKIVMTKWFGEPQLFVAFYTKWDPSSFQPENAKLIRYEQENRAWLDQLEPYEVGDWQFKYINWVEEVKSPRTLYIGKKDDFWVDSKIVKTINYPNGEPAFLLVEP